MRIAQASSSENYTKYGVAPNQRRTGVTASKPQGNLDGELNVVNFNGGWECVYRAIDPAIAEKIAAFMYESVANKNVGYSQDNTRFGLFDKLKEIGSTNPKDVKTPVNVDCATDIGAAIYNAGIHDDRLRALVTWKMDDVLMSTNAFIKLTSKELCEQGKGLRRGDVLWRTGHVACALDNDTSNVRVNLNNDGLFFTDTNNKTIGKYPNNVNMDSLFYFKKVSFNGIEITAGTAGTRAVQRTVSVAKSGYRPVVARLTYVTNSALVNVVPFFGWNDEDRLSVNFYRASGASGKVDATIMVIYVLDKVTKP